LGKLNFLPPPRDPALLLNNRIPLGLRTVYLRIYFWVKDVLPLFGLFPCLKDTGVSKGIQGDAREYLSGILIVCLLERIWKRLIFDGVEAWWWWWW